jgi:hypothetical protein
MKKPKLMPGDEIVMRRAVRGTDIQKNDRARVLGYDPETATYRLRFGRFKNPGRDSMKPVDLPRKGNFELSVAGRETLRKLRGAAKPARKNKIVRKPGYSMDKGLDRAVGRDIVAAIRDLTKVVAAAWIPGVYPPDRTGRLPLFDLDAANG